MTDPSRRLPDRPSLEQLSKQAKEKLREWLADPTRFADATLAQAQFALAREYGFESWSTLKHHIESLRGSTLAEHDRVAEDIVSAYRIGDPEALQRLGQRFERPLTREILRGQVQYRLQIDSDSAESANFGIGE